MVVETKSRRLSQFRILSSFQEKCSINGLHPVHQSRRSCSGSSRLLYSQHSLGPDITTCTFIALVLSAALIGCTGDDSIIKPVDLSPIQTSKLTSCESTQFLCQDQLKCIDKSQECDLSVDCYDGSDEHSNCPQIPCKNGTFQCQFSKRCIPQGWLCDGTSDCGFTEGHMLDQSDEQNEHCHEEHVCMPNNFKCGDNISCIKLVDVCNGLPECPDGSDEGEFCRSTSLCSEASHCKYGCRPTPTGGPVCYCPIGKEFNGTDCVDSNQCSITGACDQICIPGNRGKKQCECVHGYTKKGSHCVAENVPPHAEPLLLYQDPTDIKWLYLNGTDVANHPNYKSPLQSAVLGVDFDHLMESVCWINHDNASSVLRCANSTNLNQFVDKRHAYLYSFEDVYKMAFDWISQNYYFVDDAREMIFVCRKDLDMCRSVIDTDLSKPRGLAIDPTAGYMFFTIWGSSRAGLERALMDGSNRTQLITKKIVYPDGITVDLPTKHVYWVDKFLDSVERVDYDGNNRRTIHRGIQQLQDITVFENNLYLVSWYQNEIITLKKFETMSNKTIKRNDKKPLEIKVYHRQRQPRVKHPCLTTHKCEEFCFPFWTSNGTAYPKCGCREGFILHADGKKCIASEKSAFIIYTKQKTGIMKSFSLRNSIPKNVDIMIPVGNRSQHLAFDYDARSANLYYSDRENFRIMKKGLVSPEEKVFIDKGVSFVEGMAVDWMGQNLYWTDENLNTIYVASLRNPTYKKLLVHANLTSPKSIVVDPKHGYVYWSNFAKGHERDGTIERMWMDGSNRKQLLNGLSWPIGLTMDYENGLLYYSDAFEYTLERIRVVGTKLTKEILYTSNSTTQGHPNDLAFFNGTIYMSVNGEVKKAAVLPTPMSEWHTPLTWETVTSQEIGKIKVFDGSLQGGTNKCSGEQGCPQLCLAIPVSPGSVCMCQDGYDMSSNGQTCEKISNYTHPLACDAEEFECRKFPKCIKEKMLCDGTNDCGDGSDEDSGPCLSTTGPCSRNFFHCGKGICIPAQAVCDGKSDCANDKDESSSSCSKLSRDCLEHEFMCLTSKRCIPKSWKCDGEVDCGEFDTSDEKDCSYPECSRTQFQCQNKSCIPLESLCDGNPDCVNREDEKGCEQYCARLKQFFCQTDNKCIDMNHKCDGTCECVDGEDELNCDGKIPPLCARSFKEFRCETELTFIMSREECMNISCGANTFRCHDGSQCIPHEMKCDSIPDCQDGSDEASCPTRTVECHYPNRRCDGGTKCIHVRKICDTKFDCEDKSDEGDKCTEDPCGRDRVANCSHSCHKTPEGHICYCPENMHLLQADKSTCVEDHPCDQWGTCSQGCKRIGKRFECFCLTDYALKEDNVTCKSIHGDTPHLVFSNRHELREINLHNPTSFNSLISNLRNSIALDFYHQDKTYQIFWTDVVDDRIYKGSLNGGSLINIDIVIQTGLATAEGLAVDWIGENLYWVESNLDQIEVAKLNGSFRKTLISGEMFSPRSIALDPQIGVLFWTDWEADAPRIERASMSGEHRSIVFKVGQMGMGEGAWPNGLTLDYTKNRIYWVDARLDSIHTIKYDGSDFRTILSEHESLSHPFAISVFESNLYWTDWRSNSVMRANKFTGKNVTTIQKTYTQPFDVKIFHPSRQPRNIKNPCGGNNGGCSHLCLLNINQTFSCGCPHLMDLGVDNKTCIPNEKMLLFSRLNEIRAVYLDKPYYHAAPPISYPLIVSPANLHFVAKYKQIYWCDAQSGETKRANISSPSIKTLIDGAAGKPLAIGVDWISDLIYIAVQNPLRNSISVTNLNGEFYSTIIYGKQDLKNINSIAVNPHKAQIYWPEGNSKSQFTIQMAHMDGSKRSALTNSRENADLEHPVSLSYDFQSNRLYWVNYNTERIQYYDFKTNGVQKISFENLKPNVITVYHNYIYFASEKQDAILRGDKTLGGKYEYVRNNTENIYSIRVYDPDEQNGTNPCSVNNGGCQHLCLPTSATKRVCKCALGYVPIQNETIPTKCRGMDTVIVYVDSSGIKGVSPDVKSNDDLLVPIPLVSFATDIDVDETNEYLYWLDNDKGRISRIKRDGTGKKTVLQDLEAAIGLAIDWNAGNMYWANPRDSMIEVAHVNGSSHYVLITDNLEKPMSLAVDPAKGYLFWSDIAKGVIERSRLDGSDRKVVVHSEPMRVADIALDMENEKIYWCDSANDKIESATYDGGSRTKVLSGDSKSHLHSPLIDKGILYWIDMGHQGGSIMSAPVNNIDESTTVAIRDNLGVTMKDLGVFSTKRQKGRNACGNNNGGCQDLCLFNGTHPVCICAHGKIDVDGKSCKPYDAFLAFSRVSSIETIHISEDVTPNAPYPAITSSEHIRNAIGLAYDFKHQRMFYSDVQLGTVNSVYFNGSNFSVIAEKQGSVEGLYYEAAHSDLYWTCSNDASINRINPYLPGAKVEKILKLSSQDKPRGIAVDPCDQRIYWTNWDMNKPSIQRAYMSGYNVESIITKDIRMPNGLTLDHKAKKLYWVDARLDKIERCELDGSGRKIIASEKPKHAFSIAVLGDYIYWSDWVLHSVMRADKYTGENLQTLRHDILKPMGIVAVSEQEEECLKDPCQILNGGCTEICHLDEYGKPTCRCNSGKILQDTGRCVAEPRNRANCTANEFRCTTGSCVDYEVTCDGITHCPDESDEEDKYCATRRCKDGYFQCPNSRCIKQSKVCDGHADCQANEDEQNCTCTADQFQCVKDGRCISKSERCNKSPDCIDASDEMNCGKVDCPKNISESSVLMEFYQCPFTTACIHKSWECDGANDCYDNSDESNCTEDVSTSSKKECHPNSFSCGDGTCILRAWTCDMDVDCENGDDEKHCQYTCKPQQFVCNSGECISSMWKCDGSPDCSDGSDEDNDICSGRNCDDDKQFRCNSTGRCIFKEYVCDGDEDCLGGEDENPPEGCANVSRSTNVVLGICSPHQFQCKNGICLSPEWVCDDEKDCVLGEDEENCPTRTSCDENGTDDQLCGLTTCHPNQFRCNNGRCISNNRKCNGMNDCGDLSDESDTLCGEEKYCSAEWEFLCKDSYSCVNESLLCNGRNDCGDNSDEIGCGIDECDNPKDDLKVCQHSCIDKKVGYQCKCFAGFKPNPNNPNLCVDINECEERACSQRCRNSLGSYKCSCLPNYILKEDGHSCKANSSEPVKLLLSNQYYIRMVDDHGAMTLLAQNLTNAVAMDYDWEGGCIYFSDVTAFGSTIKRLCIASKNSSEINAEGQLKEETLHHITVQSPDGLAVDWIGKNLYWCDKGTDTIEVSRLDGSFRKVLIHDRLQEPRGIALDPLHGQMFWTDWGDEPHIGRAGMDGSNFKILISENLGWPNALTISHETNELFWADAKEDYIAVSDFNGGNRKTIHSRVHNPSAKIHHIFAITTFEDMIWWSDWETKSVEKCHKYTGQNETRVATTIHRPMDVKVFHPFRQPSRHPNPCENRGGCQTLCLLTPGGGAVCACPENFILTENQRNCTNNCTSSQFECKSTLKCIPSWWVCDGQNDCSSDDNSDEPSSCPPFNCTPGQYQCSSGECIHPASLCDAKNDCADGSDEKNCERHTCFGTQFKCEGNGTVKPFCIPLTYRCDGKADCPGGQDELNCATKTCPDNQFACKNKKCIQPEWACDLEDDCGDGSDEAPHLNCTQRSCDTNNKFRCRSGKCIPLLWHCDGEKDCSQGEDEPEACSNPEEHPCEPTYFRCNNHRCIPSRWRCDYDDDCGDNSDEIKCTPRNCSESEWKCGDGRCIRNNLRCNGEYNCQDRSDEQNCNTTCTPQEFVCENPKFCIFGGWRCDGDADCLDGSDEKNCGNRTGCHPDQFNCSNGECLSLSWRCDGEKDCADGSDEEPEMCKNTACEPGKFGCRSNNICIPYSKTCDGANDCPDGSDEQVGMCPQKRNHCNRDQFQCESSHKCINASLVCDSYNDCLDNSDEMDCIPCTFGSCSHTCVVKKSSGALKHNFTCECAEHYRISHDGNRSYCHALGDEAFMLLATENQVLRTNPSKPLTDETEILMTDTAFHSKVESLDYLIHPVIGIVRVFYTTGTRRAIQELKISLQGNSNNLQRLEKREIIVPKIEDVVTGLDEPKGIAVDWVAERIYWLDSGHRTLSVSTLDGSQRLALISKGLVEPFEIALDPESGRMYWTDWSDQRIGVAFMDGSGKKTLAQSPCPMGLAIDYPARRLYWSDIKSHTLETVTLDGRDRRIVKRFKAADDLKPNRIDVFEDWVYLTSYHNDKIHRIDKFGRDEPTHWLQGASDTLIVQTYKKRELPNPCKRIFCQSPGMCLLSGNNTATCVCPDGRGVSNSSNATHEFFICKSGIADKCDLKCKQGHCKIENGVPKCVCNSLYEGVLCEKYRCSEYCYNKGICYQDLMAIIKEGEKAPLKCDCPPEFSGDRCEIPIVSCKGHCNNNGKCNETTNVCACRPGYTGRLCEACDMLSCENQAVCKLDLRNKPYCQCLKGYSGYRCDKSICDNYCRNKGKCKVKNGSPECSCPSKYHGKQCEVDICEQLCFNGGRCDGHTCTCAKPYVGVRCEHNLCECQKCSKTDPKCQCPPNVNSLEEYCLGANDTLSIRCKPSYCKHGGTCLVIDDKPYCRCPDTWVGSRCEISSPLDKPCQSYCMHGGICIMQDTSKKPTCKCLLGWTGPRCELKTSCSSGFCFNGGTCIPNSDNTLQPICECPEGFFGLRCGSRVKSSSESTGSEESGVTWVLVLVFICVAVSVAGISGCMAYVVMRRKQYGFNRGRPFMHVRMHDAGTVEINNPMFLKEEGDEDHASEPSLIFDSDKVLLQGTNFANPVYDMYKEGESSTGLNDEKKGLLQGEDFSSSADHPLADPLA